jgi:hypothetical protein
MVSDNITNQKPDVVPCALVVKNENLKKSIFFVCDEVNESVGKIFWDPEIKQIDTTGLDSSDYQLSSCDF